MAHSLVHNGIIENFSSLREELLARGHRFLSQTDTEVLSHLIEDEYDDWYRRGSPPTLPEAVRGALTRVQGAYAIAAFCREEPGMLVGARLFSPLIIGLGRERTIGLRRAGYHASYPTRMLVEDGEVVVLTRGRAIHTRKARNRP